MKKTEAISILATSVRPREPKDRARYDEAVKMAIEALKCSETPKSSDCISRQAAIDALDEQIEQCNKALSSFDISPKDEYAIKVERASLKAYRELLENLPSAQPEYEPVTAEEFAKTMSENTLYGFMAWHGEALALMNEMGFVICKMT